MDTEETGRREQNRRRTHQALVRAAAELFREQGYEATTVRDIAAAAGVGERTFFRYFRSKESLILQQVRELIPVLTERILGRPAAEPPLVALREAVLELAATDHTAPAVLLVGPQPFVPEPTTKGDRFLLFDLEEAVAGAFLTRAGHTDPGLDERLWAASLGRAGVAALRSVRLVFTRLTPEQQAVTDVPVLVRTAFAALGCPV
ncbi:TetR/AcrR family transcriptional regulator [Kitasatospora sp. NPDC006697]|uniref:TetR/AcrR family transcriptional regulator n=1 Tax=Kitasatospora sp. NPDC006697 TaxID=3364020 RepID=UPI0036CD7837